MIDRLKAIRVMRREVKEAVPSARFLDPVRLRALYPERYEELIRLVRVNGRQLADCIFYDHEDGVSVSMLTEDPAELTR